MKSTKKTEPKPKITSVTNKEIQKLVHLLQVNQIELEHQNQELRIAQVELEVSRNKYVNLFDFAPIPYFTLNIDGIIKEVNLIASQMIGIDRNKLVGKRFITFVPLEERDVFNLFISTLFKTHIKNSCKLNIINKGKREFHVRLEGLELEDTLQADQICHIALIDLTESVK